MSAVTTAVGPHPTGMHTTDAATRDRIRGEYQEMPGLRLTAAQASRFWHLGLDESRRLLEALVADGALARTADGYYVFHR